MKAITLILILISGFSYAQKPNWQDTLGRHQRNIIHYDSMSRKDKRYIKLRDKEIVEYNLFVLKHKGQ